MSTTPITDLADQDELLLDWNESPLGPPPVAVRRLIEVAGQVRDEPRGLAAAVTELAARHLGVTSGQVLLTAGVDEAIDLAMTLADRGLALEPGFDFHSRFEPCRKAYAAIPLGPDWQPAGVPGDLGPRDVLFVAQPGNPTGNLTDEDWIARCRATGCYYFRDETYEGFCSAPSVLPHGLRDGRILVYRSFAKSWGLAGLRVGCLLGNEELIARLSAARGRPAPDAISLHAAAAVLREPGFAATLTSFVRWQRPVLVGLLRESGLFTEVRDTETNFVIARPAVGPASAFADELARHHVRIKSCDYFGMPDWIRIGVPDDQGLRRLGQALAQLRPAASR
jgi:histidinol-phosphate aminotransferase